MAISCTNSIAVIDTDGGRLSQTHIPDDHYYQEKFYFTPWKLPVSRSGIHGWYWHLLGPVVPTARCLALNGAELLFIQQLLGRSDFGYR